MNSLRAILSGAAQVALVLATLALAACGSSAGGASGSGTSNGGTSNGESSSAASTAAPKAKPTGLPTITMAFCQGILSIAEANQLMQPATPATTIRLDNPNSGKTGSCNYEYAPYKAVVSVVFVAPIPASAQGQPIANHLPSNATPGIVLTQVVSGVGDQAEYVASSVPAGGLTTNLDTLDVYFGAIFFDCNRPYLGTSVAASDQAPITKVCQLVVSRL